MRFLRVSGWSAIIALAGLAACKSSSPTGPTAVSSFVTSVEAPGATAIQAAPRTGSPPAANGGPVTSVQGQDTTVNGGASAFTLTSTTPFKKVLVAVESSGTSVDGFFELDLPAETTSQTVLMSYGSSIPKPTFGAKFQTVTAAGLVGQAASFQLRVVSGSEATGALLITFTPERPQYLNGAACTLLPGFVCAYEFTVTVKELNGVAIQLTSSQQSFQLPGSGGPRAPALQPTQVPARGSVNILTGVACANGDSLCMPGLINPINFTQPTLFSLTYFGTDANGHQVSFSAQVTLQAR